MDRNEALMQITSIKLKAEEIFNSLRKDLLHSVMIVCVKPNNQVQYYNSDESDSFKYDFSNIFQLADSLRNVSQGKFVVNTNPIIQEDYERYFAQSEFNSAIKMVVQQMDFEHKFEVFVSGNIIRSREVEKGYLVLRFNKFVYDDIYKIPTASISRIHFFSNIVDSTIHVFFDEVSKAEDHESDGFNVSSINSSSVINNSGLQFMSTPTANLRNGDGMFGLANKLNAISALEYEKKQIKRSSIILTYKDNPIITYKIRFKEPVCLNNAKHIRKLLEMTTDRMKLISDASLVYGLGEITTSFNPAHGEVYEVIFTEQFSWTLYHDNKNVLTYFMGNPSLPRNIISQEEFADKFLRVFGNDEIHKNYSNHFYNIVYNAIEEHVGTIIVISENAQSEAERLKGQSMLIEPMKLLPDNISGMIKIDGAILSDEKGVCYSIGTILDGLAVNNKGNSARGSRYNSSIRYYYSQNKKCNLLIIIISDDGDVNILPELPPKLKKNIIATFISTIKKKYEAAKKGNKIDVGEFNSLCSIVHDLHLYFSKEECNSLNDYFRFLENNCEQNGFARLVFTPLIANPDYDEKLYFEAD